MANRESVVAAAATYDWDVGTTAKTLPDFPGMWTDMLVDDHR